MKNLNKNFLKSLLLITFSFCLFSCSESPLNGDDDDNGSGNGSSSSGNKLKTGQIEIKAYPEGTKNTIIFSATAKKVTVNWGDGSVDEFTSNGVEQRFSHSYPNTNFQTITVNTEDLKTFYIHSSNDSRNSYNGDFKELRIGKCPELIELFCSSINQHSFLTVLEISDAPKLTRLECHYDYYSSGGGLTSLDVSKCPALTSLKCYGNRLTTNALNNLFKSLPTRQKSENATIAIGYNSASSDCDRTIAEKKMWTVSYY